VSLEGAFVVISLEKRSSLIEMHDMICHCGGRESSTLLPSASGEEEEEEEESEDVDRRLVLVPL
jgi:hypothetical protein